jgi:hypothetical protein
LNLVAMFVEDRSLVDIAGLPCVRELRALGGSWQPIEIGQLAAELEHSAATARRLFADIAQGCSVETSFRVEKGSAAEVIGSLATAEDIVVIIEPKNPAERVTQQFTRLVDAAFQASAAVMIVPSRVARVMGPIVAVATGADDPSIDAAMGIAAAAHDRLIVVGPFDKSGSNTTLPARAASAGVRVDFIRSMKGPLQAAALAGFLHEVKERLIVMRRGTLTDDAASNVAALRSTPVVILEPARSAQAGKRSG